jgi:hypothetical protein
MGSYSRSDGKYGSRDFDLDLDVDSMNHNRRGSSIVWPRIGAEANTQSKEKRFEGGVMNQWGTKIHASLP